ncbi:putative ABC transport system permease protein [Hymenobacter luteus]|uniref:ABC transport system permease protein n=2 Tax=Hymenobacter TaxID=89966 RepID=A0ABR6JXB4_9BACT|nr:MULTISPECIES: ABC transporter permease [Hymenobacter]MBB4601437.1 putative ABC transport system permease protein [Hymenobacter latericoloratus]MBB6058356.1 putative ABC transport system permease protein [Hymenobacter luteus]
MIRHLFTLIWNRKRSNFLLMAEILLSFFVLFVVSVLLVNNYYNYRQPMGFASDNVWQFDVNPGQDTIDRKETLQRLVQELKATPGVAAVTWTSDNTPFSFSNMNTDEYLYKDKQAPLTEFYDADDDMAKVLSLNVVAGRWFDRRDDASSRHHVVVNKRFAEEMFGQESAVGKVMTNEKHDEEWQVVGVVEAYRSGSDFAANEPALFSRRALQNTARLGNTEQPILLVRVQPGSAAVLEQQLVRKIKAVTKGWDANVNTLAENRKDKMKFVMTPLIALGMVGVFLILNVALGLFGVLWFNISQRKSEIGLRRALGATGNAISGQFLGEMLVVTTLGVIGGWALAVQFPLLGVFGLPAPVYFMAMILATALIFLLTAICAFQPSRQAAGIHPAVALREE